MIIKHADRINLCISLNGYTIITQLNNKATKQSFDSYCNVNVDDAIVWYWSLITANVFVNKGAKYFFKHHLVDA